MSNTPKMNLVFITDEGSEFNENSSMFKTLFDKTELISDENKALKFISQKSYEVVVNDVSKHPIDGITFVKQIKQLKPDLIVAALIAPEDEDKIGGLIEMGVHSFVLEPEQLDQALEVIAGMQPDKKREATT